MNGYEHLVWAPTVVSAAYFGHRVAVTWLNQRDAKAVRDEARDVLERGAVAQLAEMKRELHEMRVEQKTFLMNARSK